MNNLSANIRSRLRDLGMTQKELAERVSVSTVMVHKLLSGKSSSTSKILDFARVLECDPDWLLSGEVKPKVESNAEWLAGIDAWDSKTPLRDDEVEIPFYTEVQLAAGNGAVETIENIGPKLRFAKSALTRNGTDSAHAVCVKVSGNSMEPVIPDGSTIGIDASKTEILDGKIFAINHDGMLRVKTLYRTPGGGMRLKSFNSEEHPDEAYSLEESKSIRIIGKVFWYSVML
jgi:phage repressor protein C with HTH and peptisase S24 domain